jgi:hypothetical protein
MPLNLSRTGLSSPAYRDWAEYTALEDGRAVGHIDEDRRVMLAVGICRTSCITSLAQRATCSARAGSPVPSHLLAVAEDLVGEAGKLETAIIAAVSAKPSRRDAAKERRITCAQITASS